MQGLPVLVGLVEDNMADNGNLTQIAVQCIWRVLELHGAGPLNHLCRLLSNAGLPHRLMRAMLSLSQEHQVLLNKAEVCAATLSQRQSSHLSAKPTVYAVYYTLVNMSNMLISTHSGCMCTQRSMPINIPAFSWSLVC